MSRHFVPPSAAVVAVFVLGLGAPVGAQRVPATRLDTDPAGQAFSSVPAIACAGRSVYVAWHDDRNGGNDIYFNRSLDGGATWLAQDVRLDTDAPGAAISVAPEIACVGSDVYVVWLDARATGSILRAEIRLNRSTDAGSTWLAQDVRLDSDPSGSLIPVICADGDAVYVAWIDLRHSVGSRDIYFNRSLDKGLTWLAQDVRLNTNPAGTAQHTDPVMACDGADVYVAWSSLRTALAFDVFLNRSSDGGATWLAQEIRLDTDPAGASNSLFVDLSSAGACVYAAWHDDRNGEYAIYLNRSIDRGATWLPKDIRLDTDPPGAALSSFPDICCEGSDVYVFWEDWRHGPVTSTATADVYMNRSSDCGTTWLANDVRISHVPLPVGSGNHTPSLPQSTCSGDVVAVCWVDVRHGLQDMYYNRSFDRGATWLPFDVPLVAESPGMSFSTSPSIASAGGAVYLVWEDDRSGATDIYFNIPHGSLAYGDGTAGSGGRTPQLAGGGLPGIGAKFTVDATNLLGGAPGALLLGVQKTALPLLGETILTLPLAVPGVLLGGTPGVPGAGVLTLPVAVPNQPALVGGLLLLQILAIDPAAPSGLSMSNGIEVWIG